MIEYNNILSEKYFSISHDFEFVEVQPSFNDSTTNTFVFVKEVHISWARRPKYYRSRITEYSIFNSSWAIVDQIWINQWHLQKIDNYGDNAPFYLVDPKGRVSSKNWGSGISGIVEAIKWLKDSSQFQSFEFMELKRENEMLQNEMEELLEQQKELIAKLNSY